MKKRLLAMVCGCLFCGGIFAQHTWFNDKDLTLTGAYYYPEHWDESQWERDLKQMHELGLNLPILRSLPGHSWSPRKECMIFLGWTGQLLWRPNMI